MPLTIPDDINYPDTLYAGGFVAAMALMATSIQDALDSRQASSYVWADQAARDAQTGMANGNFGFQQDNSSLYMFNGTTWRLWERAWTAYTPTVNNFNSASAAPTISGWYSVSSGMVDFTVTAKLGTGTITVGAISISTPVAIDTTGMILNSSVLNASASFEDVSAGSTGYFGGQVRVSDANTIVPLRYSAANVGVIAVTSSSLPFTWATLDVMTASGRYPAA